MVILIFSCDLLESITEIDFNADVKITYAVELDDEDNNINEAKTLTLTEDNQVEKYKDKIEDLKIDSVVVYVESYNGPSELKFDGLLKYSMTKDTIGIDFAQIDSLDLSELYEKGLTYRVEYDEGELINIQQILFDEKEIKVYLVGIVSDMPAMFKLAVRFYTTIVAQALD